MKEYYKYEKLLQMKEGERIFYSDLLMTEEWRFKREKIINRDLYKCTTCKCEPTVFRRGKHYRKVTYEERRIAREALILSFKAIRKVFYEARGIEWNDENFEPRSVNLGTANDTEADNPVFLHVHHKYYIHKNLPWQYDNECLITVCEDCHLKIHQEAIIPVYFDEAKSRTLNLSVCPRCHGTGVLTEYRHVQNGICFGCNGERYLEFV